MTDVLNIRIIKKELFSVFSAHINRLIVNFCRCQLCKLSSRYDGIFKLVLRNANPKRSVNANLFTKKIYFNCTMKKWDIKTRDILKETF